MDKQRIKEEAAAFFEWPSDDKTYVTTKSMLIFTSVIAEMTCQELRDEVKRLRHEITLTLEENGQLADGDVCTLSRLKSALQPND